jgi:hypothetical protein
MKFPAAVLEHNGLGRAFGALFAFRIQDELDRFRLGRPLVQALPTPKA